MKIYRIDKHTADDQDSMVDRAVEDANGNWVPADVAKGLYQALDQIRDCNSLNAIEMIAEKALAAADGGGDDE